MSFGWHAWSKRHELSSSPHPNAPSSGTGGGGTPSGSVTSETSFGLSTAAGSSSNYSRGDHTHGSPTNPITAHEAAGDPHTAYLLETNLPYYAQVVVHVAPYGHSGYNFDRDVMYGRSYATADGHWIEWSVLLAAGTYSLEVWYYLWDNGGIFDVTVDGGAVEGSVDTYAAVGQTPNNASTVTGITVTGGGRHTVRFTTNGKNASSADYLVLLCGEWSMRRTGA